MLISKTPSKYINEAGAVKRIGQYIQHLGKNPLIIAGKTAYTAVKENLNESLSDFGISTDNVELFNGYPSENRFKRYSDIAYDAEADFIIGIGGGRALDTSKAVADITGLPLVTVPTVAATCAAWAALSIQYDDEGAFVRVRENKKCADVIVADQAVLFNAPTRYLFSGVVDTFAKLYETRASLERANGDTTLNIALYASDIAFKSLEESTFKAIDEAKDGIYGKAAKDVIDAIIYLAGFAGSFQRNVPHYGFAHPFYHISTRLPNTRIRLHGEKVAFGIVSQLFLEKRPVEEITRTIELFNKYGTAYTLSDIGIDKNAEDDINYLALEIPKVFPYVSYSYDEIKKALTATDELTKKFLNK
jgi:glycerol dehydrogenase